MKHRQVEAFWIKVLLFCTWDIYANFHFNSYFHIFIDFYSVASVSFSHIFRIVIFFFWKTNRSVLNFASSFTTRSRFLSWRFSAFPRCSSGHLANRSNLAHASKDRGTDKLYLLKHFFLPVLSEDPHSCGFECTFSHLEYLNSYQLEFLGII